jgi:hypothetical protein
MKHVETHALKEAVGDLQPACGRQHQSASPLSHSSLAISICQHTNAESASAYVSMRMLKVPLKVPLLSLTPLLLSAYISIRQRMLTCGLPVGASPK